MSDAATKSFYDHPRTFMRRNIVLPPDRVPLSYIKNHMIRFELIKARGNCRVTNKAGAEVWQVSAIQPPISRGYRAYYCGYDDNDGIPGEIGPIAEFFFTEKMNGCTLAVGSLTPNGIRKVGHFNAKAASEKAEKQILMYDQTPKSKFDLMNDAEPIAQKAQAREQRKMARDKLGQDALLIQPKDYRGAFTEDVTTFGINKKNKAWKFYTLKYSMDTNSTTKGAYQHLGLHRQLGNVMVPLQEDDNDEEG